MEKIGTSNYYWSFPSDTQQKKNTHLMQLRDEFSKLEETSSDLESRIQQAKSGREDNGQRDKLLSQLAEAEALHKELEAELRKYADNDPSLLEAQKKYSQIAKDAANKWTENIFVFQSYCVDKFNVDRQEFNRNFQIPEDLDTIP
ncbi:Meiotic nuclear division protein 1 [Podila epigama]|nr:Meiotic nuclear division protein 1 [Podila epigama]